MGAIGNTITWFIAVVIQMIWFEVGMFLGIFGMWQVGLDGVLSTLESFAFEAMTATYANDLTFTV